MKSIYIPIGAKHRLENPGKIDLELIEELPRRGRYRPHRGRLSPVVTFQTVSAGKDVGQAGRQG
jgi:hypothetical protein